MDGASEYQENKTIIKEENEIIYNLQIEDNPTCSNESLVESVVYNEEAEDISSTPTCISSDYFQAADGQQIQLIEVQENEEMIIGCESPGWCVNSESNGDSYIIIQEVTTPEDVVNTEPQYYHTRAEYEAIAGSSGLNVTGKLNSNLIHSDGSSKSLFGVNDQCMLSKKISGSDTRVSVDSNTNDLNNTQNSAKDSVLLANESESNNETEHKLLSPEDALHSKLENQDVLSNKHFTHNSHDNSTEQFTKDFNIIPVESLESTQNSDKCDVLNIECKKRDRLLSFEKFIKCLHCNKIFATKAKMLKHLKLFHKKMKSCKYYECSACLCQFKFRVALISHFLKMHKYDVRTFVCNRCEKAFRCCVNLDHHLRLHNREDTCICNDCNLKFPSENSLLRHKRRDHNPSKPYVCVQCSMGFARSSALDGHVKIHKTIDGWHKCVQCNKRFTLRSELKQHLLLK